jgi:hypothetical protein
MNDIFSYTWEQIQKAQQGGKLSHGKIDVSKPVDHSLMAGDLDLLAAHGMDGLREKQFWGVIARLQRNGY